MKGMGHGNQEASATSPEFFDSFFVRCNRVGRFQFRKFLDLNGNGCCRHRSCFLNDSESASWGDLNSADQPGHYIAPVFQDRRR